MLSFSFFWGEEKKKKTFLIANVQIQNDATFFPPPPPRQKRRARDEPKPLVPFCRDPHHAQGDAYTRSRTGTATDAGLVTREKKRFFWKEWKEGSFIFFFAEEEERREFVGEQ